MIAAGLIDAAVVGGVDSLCLTTLYGFHALQLTAPGACRPFDLHRNGLSIGEAAAFALLERSASAASAPGPIFLLGYGESSDAHHMSSPHPEGAGARAAMQRALDTAALSAAEVDYINLHGTGTPSNDAAESIAVNNAVRRPYPLQFDQGGHRPYARRCWRTRGHHLRAGAAPQLLPAGLNRTEPDPKLRVNYLTRPARSSVRTALSNSFGFGGVNCALLFGCGTG